MREAEGSLVRFPLDQASGGGENHHRRQPRSALGLIDRRAVLTTLTAVLRREPLKAVEAAGEVYQFGGDLRVLARELLRMIRL